MAIPSRPRSKLTYAEYLTFPSDGQRHELVAGEHCVNPAPSTYHQTLSRRIQFQLYEQIELTGLGLVFNAPVDLQLSEHDVVQPDLLVVLQAKRLIITSTKIKGAPDMIIEILSESTAELDRVLKKDLYQRSGVGEYWIVDPVEHSVEQFMLTNGRLESIAREKEWISAHSLPDTRVDLRKVW